jgi:hypothetical protein
VKCRGPLLAIAALLAPAPAALAAEAGAGTGAGEATTSAPSADKSYYTLCNPTPADQMRDMDTDRPNKTNTPHTIDAGHLQIETGIADYLYFRDRSAGNDTRSDTWSVGQFNFRVGILNDLELNAISPTYNFNRFEDFSTGQVAHHDGFGDTIVGGKLNLWGNDGGEAPWATALAIQPQVKLATAQNDLGDGHTEALMNIPLLIHLPGGFNLGLQATPAWERTSDNTGYTAGFGGSISIDRVIFDKFDLFLEYASHLTAEEHQKGQGTVDMGVIYQATPNLSFDTAINLGVNDASPTFEWLIGMSVRL